MGFVEERSAGLSMWNVAELGRALLNDPKSCLRSLVGDPHQQVLLLLVRNWKDSCWLDICSLT